MRSVTDGGRIAVRVEHTAGRAVLEVEDDGPGIPPEALEHIFEPFFTLRRQGRGSGLGLAVVYSIVSTHGGEVDVRSAPGERTRFVIRLPLGEASALEAVASRTAENSAVVNLLLVESDGRAAASLVESLAVADFEVRHATSLELADELAEIWEPAVVVLGASAERERGGAGLVARQLPVVILGEIDGDSADRWGPRAVRLLGAVDPQAIVEALHELVAEQAGEIDTGSSI